MTNSTTFLKYIAIAHRVAMRLGAETFPVTGKLPAMNRSGARCKWLGDGQGMPGVVTIDPEYWENATGYGVRPLGDLAIVEYDDPDFGQRILKTIPRLAETYTVGRGERRHWYVKGIVLEQGYKSLKDGKRELASIRGRGAYVVGAGSIHPSGDEYKVVNDAQPIELTPDERDALLALFEPHSRQAEPPPKADTVPYPAYSKINPILLREVITRLSQWEGRELHFSTAGTASLYRNPFRDDDAHRSAFFSGVTGWLHDRATGASMNLAQVCTFLGINMNRMGGMMLTEPPTPERRQLSPEAEPIPPAPRIAVEPPTDARRADYWHAGVPDPLREVLLNIDNQTGLADQCPALIVWELFSLARREGLIEPRQTVTVRRLQDAAMDLNWNTSRWTVEKGIEQALAWGILRDVSHESERYGEGGETFDFQQNPVGRPSRRFRFRKIKVAVLSILAKVRFRVREWCFGGIGSRPSIPDAPDPSWFTDDLAAWKSEFIVRRDAQALAAEYQRSRAKAQAKYEKLIAAKEAALRIDALVVATSTPLLTDRPYTNMKEYRDNLYLSKVRADPDRQISRSAAARELGRSPSTISAMSRRAGIERVPQYRVWELGPGASCLAQVRGLAEWTLDHPAASLVACYPGDNPKSPDVLAGTPLDNPGLDRWAADQWRAGRKVFLRVQVASRERESGEPSQPAPARPRSASEKSPSRRSAIVWKSYSPRFVEAQLTLRNLKDLGNRGLADLNSGEIYYPAFAEAA